MKKERIETLVDSFVDANGEKRYFVIAAISEMLSETFSEEDDEMSVVSVIIGDYICDEEVLDNLVKGLKIGYAICNPLDTFNEELGRTIAVGRARKNSSYALYASKAGYINSKMVKAFLEQEAEFFKKNPENYIAGYKRKK